VIVLVDYGAANLRSVCSGFERETNGLSIGENPFVPRDAPCKDRGASNDH
jgi:imidazoleglycerol phosphate synthase glutamine amidotransferase subunit HisH